MATPARPPGRFSALLSEIEIAMESELGDIVGAELEIRAARYAEDLNQAVRRLRLTSGFQELAAAVVDGAAPYCDRCAVFEAVGENMALRAGRGVTGGVIVPVSIAGAFRAAADSGDPVFALATPAEVSQAVVNLFSHAIAERVFVFPMGKLGLLYACGNVRPAALELLAQVAGMAAGAPPRAQEPANLVTITPLTAPAAASDPRPAWLGLDSAEQRVHLRAQQYARTVVAQMRLHQAEAVLGGRQQSDLYGTLKTEIDAAREAFQREFLPVAPTMVDYIHLELLRTLAHDDSALLGPGYPGPLV